MRVARKENPRSPPPQIYLCCDSLDLSSAMKWARCPPSPVLLLLLWALVAAAAPKESNDGGGDSVYNKDTSMPPFAQ